METKATFGAAVALTVLTTSAPAAGQITATAAAAPGSTFGRAGSVVVGAERLLGVQRVSLHEESEQDSPLGPVRVEIDITRTEFNLLGTTGGLVSNSPRLGFDYFVVDHLSIGTAIIYLTRSGKQETKVRFSGTTQSEDTDQPDEQALVLHPRVGYATMFTDVAGVWARGGLTYSHIRQEEKVETSQGLGSPTTTTEETKINLIQIPFEVFLVLSPVDHFAFLLGGNADIGVTGNTDFDDGDGTNVESDARATSFGVLGGVAGWF